LSTIYCPYRKEHVAAQPEEVVRLNLLTTMTERLGYPTSCIVIEKALSQLPHLTTSSLSLPNRRVDILVYTNIEGDGLIPLLLIECKAVPLNHKTLQQVAGYNHYIGAPFICVANADQLFMGWVDKKLKSYQYIDFLPTYKELWAWIK
jgi:Type I restriction enzyme R protein N terminus (HSDR_N)